MSRKRRGPLGTLRPEVVDALWWQTQTAADQAEPTVAQEDIATPACQLGLERLWEKDRNPFYAWQAIYNALGATQDGPEHIPDWAVEYLRHAAKNLTELAQPNDRDIAKAIGLGTRQGKKRPFLVAECDAQDIWAAFAAVRSVQTVQPVVVIKPRNVSSARRLQIVQRGKKLLGQPIR